MTSAVPYAEVIGDPIAHSKSPLIHGFWLEKLGLNRRYGVCRVSRTELPDYLAERRSDPVWCGCNVTMPLKTAAAALVDELSPEAQAIGAINCVVRAGMEGGQLVGNNTDGRGVQECLAPFRHSGTRVHLLGSGGAAAAAAHAILQQPGTVLLSYARTRERALAFRGRVDPDQAEHLCHALDELSFGGTEDPSRDIFINATPLGMRGHAPLPVDLSSLPPGSVVFDMVYDPVETDLLRQARERGLKTIDGLSMLIGQAAAAFALFFREAAPRGHDAELRRLLLG
jgi:shikimate dehydrogenase